MNYIVYKHTSPSGKVYIGITKNKPEYRWNHGRGYKEKDQPLFHRAIKKYGWDNITHEILYRGLSERDAKNIEISLIRIYKKLDMSYNITDGGDGFKGIVHSKGRKMSLETRKKMSISRKGLFKGTKNPMYGRHETNPAYGKFGVEHPASKKVYQYSIDGEFIKKWDCISDVQRELGIIVTHITACCNGRQKTAGGYIWVRQFDARLALDREKLAFDKDKTGKELDIKRRALKKKSNTSK